MFCAVGLGAFGAHGLRDFLQQHGYAAVWETAVLYQLIHALALFAAGLFARARPEVRRARSFVFAGRLLLAGTLLFSGSLYALCLGAPKWIGPVTPLGGLSLMAGWIGYGIWSLRAGISTKREA
ncbi:MAG: DUF423 domain-containing protein [Verrucomicrobia bacterium]|nr:MAG: DUF423 domain-containing protein [Verrucomicrobiota bacterium]